VKGWAFLESGNPTSSKPLRTKAACVVHFSSWDFAFTKPL